MTTVPESMLFLQGQPAFLEQQGFSPLYVSSPSSVLDAFGERERCETLGVEMKRSINPLNDLRSILDLVRVFRNEKPAIVHAHTPKGGLLGMISAKISRTPVNVYQIHGFPYMGLTGVKRQLLMMAERVSCIFADQVLCVSHSIAAVAVQDRIVRAGKLKILANGSANGVDALGRFNPENVSEENRRALRASLNIDQDAQVVSFVGRLAKDKGISELIDAWATVRQQCPTAILMLLGFVDERDPIDESALAQLQMDSSIRVVGFKKNTEDYYAISDLTVLPSYREGFPTSLLEAAAMRLPAVVTDIPGCIDAVENDVTGLVVPLKNAPSLADAIIGLLNNKEKRDEMGVAARERAIADFDPEYLWTALVDEYRRLLKKAGFTEVR